jgi:cell wall-associated NlpC family hydrolase
MLRRLSRFVRRHKHAEEVAGEAIGLNLLWALLRGAGIFGAGVAVAAIASTSSAPPARVAVPHRLALETHVQKQLVRFAHRYGPGSGIVYVWGGSGPFGFDCSGFAYYIHRRVGISIPRDSRSQWTSLAGRDVGKGHEKPGDIVYFDGSRAGVNAGPPPGHEGVYIGGGRFIEYYSTGHPAKVVQLRYEPGYMGAKQWWHRTTVQKRHAHEIFWFARHFHVKIASAGGRSVTFKPWRGHGRMSRPRFQRILRWAHDNGHHTGGNRRHLAVRF